MKARIGSPDERRSQTDDQPHRGMRRWGQDNAEEPSIGIGGPLTLPKIVVSNHESGSVWRDGVSPKDLPQGRPHHGFFMWAWELANHNGEKSSRWIRQKWQISA
jgi:hypothetical protein